jgi:hypothetical protein
MLSHVIQPLDSLFEQVADFFFCINGLLDGLQSRGLNGYAMVAFIGIVSLFRRRKPRV